jgi:uncharacterized protein (TIGR03084 family)
MTKSSAKEQLQQQVDALRAEGQELYATLRKLSDGDWSIKTTFKTWTIWDVMAHLHSGDHMGLTTLHDAAQFNALRKLRDESALSRLEYTRQWLSGVDGPELRELWYEKLQLLCDAFAQADPDQRLAWSGPGMKPRMFVTARLMETWAHGTEIYDRLKLPRTFSNRLHGIATLGVRTYGWTFSNRGQDVPGPAPYVKLTAPSGETWEWNEPSTDNCVFGSAADFCQVVTQVRNVADVALTINGAAAKAWMEIAQCFAGPPEDPPTPGSRAVL